MLNKVIEYKCATQQAMPPLTSAGLKEIFPCILRGFLFVQANDLFCAKLTELKSILTEQQVALSIKRLAHQVLENHLNLENTVLIGMQPRGIYLSDRIIEELKKLCDPKKIAYGKLDITFCDGNVSIVLPT